MSVITPVLNRASTLPSCLASVAAQTHPHLEHIVVDGGSTDGTLDILKSFSASHPMRWVTGGDEGMYDAINKGLSLAKGEVIAYLNSDDLYLPWSVEAAVEKLADDADLVYGDLGVLQLRGQAKSRFFVQFYPPFDLRHYTYFAAIAQPTVFWRRGVTDDIGPFDADYKLLGDCEYWLRAAVSGRRLSHVKEVLAVQIEHGETLRRTQRERLVKEQKQLRAEYSQHAGAPPRLPRLETYRRSVRWRLGEWRLLLAYSKKDPKRWPRFVSFLKRHNIPMNSFRTLMWFTLPPKLRPGNVHWVSTGMFEKAILDEIGARDLGPIAPSPTA